MSASFGEEIELTEKHEQILGRRAELLQQMENRKEQLRVRKEQKAKESEEAHQRNSALLQDLQKIEDRLGGRPAPSPRLLDLETKYWASVEESVPVWENFLLGKGPHPADAPGPPARRTRQRTRTAKEEGLPPRPKPRATP